MYLAEFTLTEKENFWVMASDFTKADGELHKKEDEYLSLYAQEMGINRSVLDKTDITVEAAVSYFEKSNSAIQIKVYIELAALALCDAEFHEKEKEWLKSIQKKFNISDEKKMEIAVILVEIFAKYTALEKIING